MIYTQSNYLFHLNKRNTKKPVPINENFKKLNKKQRKSNQSKLDIGFITTTEPTPSNLSQIQEKEERGERRDRSDLNCTTKAGNSKQRSGAICQIKRRIF